LVLEQKVEVLAVVALLVSQDMSLLPPYQRDATVWPIPEEEEALALN
jgi:hypothetical protein